MSLAVAKAAAAAELEMPLYRYVGGVFARTLGADSAKGGRPNGTVKRWLGTTWNTSPARMYSFARSTTAMKPSRVKLEAGSGRAAGRAATGSGCASAVLSLGEPPLRGASSGYKTLVTGLRALPIMAATGYPGGVRRHAQRAATGRAGRVLRRPARVCLDTGPGGAGGGGGRRVHGMPPRPRPPAQRRRQHGGAAGHAGRGGAAGGIRSAGEARGRGVLRLVKLSVDAPAGV